MEVVVEIDLWYDLSECFFSVLLFMVDEWVICVGKVFVVDVMWVVDCVDVCDKFGWGFFWCNFLFVVLVVLVGLFFLFVENV